MAITNLPLCAAIGMLAGSQLPAQIVAWETPAARGSVTPNLSVGAAGELYLSWLEPAADGRHALRFARRDGDEWAAPRTIASGDDWFVNWADFPSLVVMADGAMAAHWLQKSGRGTYAYDVCIARSRDGGASWGEAFRPHRDGTQTEHGFVSMLGRDDGSLAVIWLDGREMKADGHGHGTGQMTLRSARVAPDGELHEETVLDKRVCECCQTAAAMTADGPIVVYRDRADDEVRDIHVVRRRDGGWSAPRPVASDNWKLAGCPVNGPAIAAAGRHVAVAWFTAANDAARVHCAFSADAGATFADPIRVDDGDPIGRAAVVMLDDGSALVAWLERTDKRGELRARRVGATDRGDAVSIGPMTTTRRSGFPRLTQSGGEVVFAWTHGGIRIAAMPVPE